VDQIIEQLGLQDCANTIIGTPFRRGISGGQRRRVSIGMELVTNPQYVHNYFMKSDPVYRIMFLDEPTSGLDSKSAASVVEVLLKLAHEENRTIICTIHSPTSQIYNMFDDVMVPYSFLFFFCFFVFSLFLLHV
jgi:ABC-type multidrug transport system ATPase subunit